MHRVGQQGTCTTSGSRACAPCNDLPHLAGALVYHALAATTPFALSRKAHLADALVAHAHAKHGEAAGAQLLDDLQADAAVLGPACEKKEGREE